MLFILDEVANFCNDTKEIWQLIGRVVTIIQYLVPLALLVWGIIDLFKAVLSGDEKERKEATSAFLKRLLYGLAVLFLVVIVKGIVRLAGKGDSLNSTCWTCVTSPKKC
jgi:Na+-driven multidrug efflux pump